MGLKKAFYSAARLTWVAFVAGAWVSLDQGYTEPWLSVSDIPGGSTGVAAFGVVLALVGYLSISFLHRGAEQADWVEAGRQAGLRRSEDSGNTSGPTLTGTVSGRTVTASYDTRKISSGDEGSMRVTFTLCGAKLAVPTDDGVVVGKAGETVDAGVGTIDFDEIADSVSTTEGLVAVRTVDLVFLGTSAPAVEADADGPSGAALRAVRDLKIASIGDGSGAIAGWAESRNEEFEGSIFGFPVENFVERIPGDATTGTVETQAAIRDGDELGRFAEGVLAFTDAFEEATKRPPASG
jgi:hypothetical protein